MLALTVGIAGSQIVNYKQISALTEAEMEFIEKN